MSQPVDRAPIRLLDRMVQDRRERVVHDGRMKLNLNAATSFLATHGRLLDRHRLQLLLEEADGEAVLGALEAYRNPDGATAGVWNLICDRR